MQAYAVGRIVEARDLHFCGAQKCGEQNAFLAGLRCARGVLPSSNGQLVGRDDIVRQSDGSPSRVGAAKSVERAVC